MGYAGVFGFKVLSPKFYCAKCGFWESATVALLTVLLQRLGVTQTVAERRQTADLVVCYPGIFLGETC